MLTFTTLARPIPTFSRGDRGAALPTVMVIVFAVTLGVLAIMQATAQTAVTNIRNSAHEELVSAGISFANKVRLNLREGAVEGDLTKYTMDNDGTAYPCATMFRDQKNSTVYARYRLEAGTNAREKRIVVETYRDINGTRDSARVSVLVTDRSELPFAAYWGSGLDIGAGLVTDEPMGVDGNLSGFELIDGALTFFEDIFVSGLDLTGLTDPNGDGLIFADAGFEVPDIRFDFDQMIADIQANGNYDTQTIVGGTVRLGSTPTVPEVNPIPTEPLFIGSPGDGSISMERLKFGSADVAEDGSDDVRANISKNIPFRWTYAITNNGSGTLTFDDLASQVTIANEQNVRVTVIRAADKYLQPGETTFLELEITPLTNDQVSTFDVNIGNNGDTVDGQYSYTASFTPDGTAERIESTDEVNAKGAKIRFDPNDPGYFYLSESNSDQNAVNNPFGPEVRQPLPQAPDGAMLIMETYKYVVVEGTYYDPVTIVAADGNIIASDNLQASDPATVPAIGLIASGDVNVRVMRNTEDFGFEPDSIGVIEARIFAGGRFGVEDRDNDNTMISLDIRASIIVDGENTEFASDDISRLAGVRVISGLTSPDLAPPGMEPTYIYGVFPFSRVIAGSWTVEY